MSVHKEISFETEVCAYLGTNGWLYAEGDEAGYLYEKLREAGRP